LMTSYFDGRTYVYSYRYFGNFDGIGEPPESTRIAPVIYWPLEQIDRRVRSGAWEADPFG